MDAKHEGLHLNESFVSTPTTANSKISKSTETSAKSLLNRSNSFSRFLGRSDSKRSQRAHNNSNANVSNLQSSQQNSLQNQQQNSDVYSQAPSSPRTLQKVSTDQSLRCHGSNSWLPSTREIHWREALCPWKK